jgi:sugar O-acyltransferase (sialic acid O-acetyltransferase NeuD family)
MLIAGAKGLAKQLLEITDGTALENGLVFYDQNPAINALYQFPVLNELDAVKSHFRKDPRFNLGVGKPAIRKKVFDQMQACGGSIFSLISPKATLSRDVVLEDGVSILTHAILENGSRVGMGTLINLAVLVCHDVQVGQFSEISPGAILLGESKVGDFTFIGSGAIINPGVKIGSHVTIGSGTVVLNDVPDGVTLVGVPARVVPKPSIS